MCGGNDQPLAGVPSASGVAGGGFVGQQPHQGDHLVVAGLSEQGHGDAALAVDQHGRRHRLGAHALVGGRVPCGRVVDRGVGDLVAAFVGERNTYTRNRISAFGFDGVVEAWTQRPVKVTAGIDLGPFLQMPENVAPKFGTVAVGGRADLVLLRANPLADITATRSIEGVMIRGRWLAKPEIDALLDGLDYADYFANKWSALLRNKRNDAKQTRGAYTFHAWIRDSLLENKPYDRFVLEILAASGDLRDNPPVAWYRQLRDPQAQLEDTAQLFLGTRLQCAQCHHHPFEKWSQNDYYSFAAFFSQVVRKPGSQPGEEVIFAKHTVPAATNKKTRQPVKPAGLGSGPLDLPPDADAREALARWMTGRENSFFARSLVNRYWKHFFSRGIVDPEDDLRETNPPVNSFSMSFRCISSAFF